MVTILEHRYAPRGSCVDLFRARDAEVLMSGPAGTGKSRACLEKVHMMCLLTPGLKALAVRKTLVSLTATGMVTYREHVAAEALQAGDVAWYGGSKSEPAAFRYANGSRLVVGGMDDPTKIMSAEYDVIFVQEAIELSEDDWEKATTRLRNGRISFQQLLADTNPDRPSHWLKARCDKGLTRMIYARHEDNPRLIDDRGQVTVEGRDYLGKLDRLTGPRYLRLRKGLWVAAEGQVYDEYDPAVHLVDRFPIPDDWPRIWGVDFGFTNPFVCQCWAIDPDGRMWLEWEVYRTRRTVDQHAATILAHVTRPDPDYRHPPGRARRAHHGRAWTAPRPRAIVCDHDAEGREVLTRELGIRTTPARKAVAEGIQTVQGRLRPAGDGRPRVFLLRDAVLERDQDLVDAKKPASTAEEFPGYVWDTGGGKAIKEQPLKLDDHGCDTARYVAMELETGGRPRMRWLG